MRKVESLLVNCYEDTDLDWPSIKHFVEKHQVEHLTIVAAGNATTEEYNRVLNHGCGISALGVCVDIHWSFYVRSPDDVRSILDVCLQKNIKSVRCVIDWQYRPSFDAIDSLLRHSKKLILIYWRHVDILKSDDLDKIHETSNVLGTEIEILCDDKGDTWWQVGIQFHPGDDQNKVPEAIEDEPDFAVHLVGAAIVMGRDSSEHPLATVTELYNRMISRFKSVEHIRNRQNIYSIINKLKSLAFTAIEENPIIDETYLEKFDICAADVQEFMTKVPIYHRSNNGDFIFLFCHRSMQKFLAASFLAEMVFGDFSRYYEEHLHNNKWRNVRQFIAGIVCSKSTNSLHKVSDRKKKQEFISHSILKQLETSNGEEDRMELYASVYETNDDDVMKNISAIDVSGVRLLHGEKLIIGSWIEKSGGLKYLGLLSYNVERNNVAIFTKCLKRRIRVDHIDLRGNTLSAEALGSFLGLNLKETKYLEWKVVRATRAIPHSIPSTIPVISPHFKLTKEGDVVKIHDDEKELKGRFHIKESKLVLDRVYWLGDLIYCSRLYEPKIIEVPDKLLYATPGDLRELSATKLEKINKILLDCTEEENVDWLRIGYSIWKYQVELLDIVATGVTAFQKYQNCLKSKNKLSSFGVDVNIHWMITVNKAYDLNRVRYACQTGERFESVRCVVEYDVSRDLILLLVGNTNKLTLIYVDETYRLNEEETRKLERISRDHGLWLEVLGGQGRDSDAWGLLDAKHF